MANAKRTQIKKVLNPNIVEITATTTPAPITETPCNEPQKSILLKLRNGDYTLMKRNMCSSVWKVYREIRRSDGTKLLGRYYCVGCNQILKTQGSTTSNLRTHKCHVEHLKQHQANLLNSTAQSSSTSITSNMATRKRKREYEMSDTEWESSNDPDEKASLLGDNEYADKKKKTKETVEEANRNSRLVYKRFNWDDDATRMFLQLWAAHIDDFRGSRTNTDIHREMAKEMEKFNVTHTEIKAKIDNMSKRYKKESEIASSTGVPSEWEHFYKLRSLLTGTASTVKAFEEIIIKHSDSDNDEESNHGSYEMKDEHLLQEDEGLDTSMLGQDEQMDMTEEHVETEEDDFREQPDPELELSPSKWSPKENRAERRLQIEEEKLQIEREKLSIMRTFKRDLTLFHKDLMEILRQKCFNK